MSEPAVIEASNSNHEGEILIIRRWIQNEANLNARMDDAFILAFLRFCQFDVQKTKERIEYFYTCRKKYPSWLKNRDPTSDMAKKVWDLGFFLPITNQIHENHPTVMIIRIAGFDPRIIPMDYYSKYALSVHAYTLFKEENCQINGISIVVDSSEITARAVTCFTIPVIRRIIDIVFSAYPLEVTAIHFIKMPKLFEAIFALFMLFFPSHIKKRVHTHGHNMDSLHKHISTEYLPSEYGGTNNTLNGLTEQFIPFMVKTKEYFDDDDSYGYIESN